MPGVSVSNPPGTPAICYGIVFLRPKAGFQKTHSGLKGGNAAFFSCKCLRQTCKLLFVGMIAARFDSATDVRFPVFVAFPKPNSMHTHPNSAQRSQPSVRL